MSYNAYKFAVYREDGNGGEVFVTNKVLKFPLGIYKGSYFSDPNTIQMVRSQTGFGSGYTYAGCYNLPRAVSSLCGFSSFIYEPGVSYGDSYYRYYLDKDNGTFIRVNFLNESSGNVGYTLLSFYKNGSLLGSFSDLRGSWNRSSGTRYAVNMQSLPGIDYKTGKIYGINETSVITYDGSSATFWGNNDIIVTEYNAPWFSSFFEGFNPIDEGNPYYDGGTSEEGGGNGNFSEDSDNPETDELPGIDAIGTGFAAIFKPSKSQLRSLSELFWNSNVFTFLQNLVENITDMFTSLAMVPFEVEAGSTVSVTWLGIDTAINLTLAAKQYYEFNMGSIDLSNDSRIFTSGSALDYSPFSTLGIYLPFIGYQELDIDECRGAVINLRYRIDILSGACVAIIKVAGRDIYQFTGNCLTQIPITNENMQSLVTDAVNVGIAAAGKQAAKGTMAATEEQIGKSTMSTERKEVAMAHATESLGHSQSRLVSATANLMASGKPSFNKTGAVSSAASMMSVKQPYLFLTTPRQSIPEHYQRYCGFPSNITGKLGDFSGYTVVENIRLNGLVATSPEVAEIYDLLKKGVIV